MIVPVLAEEGTLPCSYCGKPTGGACPQCFRSFCDRCVGRVRLSCTPSYCLQCGDAYAKVDGLCRECWALGAQG